MSFYTRMIVFSACLFGWSSGFAELLDVNLVNDGGNVNAPLGVINKSLPNQIGAGRGDVNTFGSSIFLIKRDPARSVRRGRQLFQRKFSHAEGQGPRVNFASTGDVTVTRALGAGLSDSCALCHGRPRGSAGFGGDVVTRPDSRDAPHLFGLGLHEQLADEMTADLRAIRTAALAAAASKMVTCTIIGTNTWPGNYQVDVRVTNNTGAPISSWQVTMNFNVNAQVYNWWDSVITNGNTTRPIARNASYNGNIEPGGSRQFGFQGRRGSGTFVPPTCTSNTGTSGTAQTRTLIAKGVNFGSITANPNGTVNTSGVRGVNPDLRIRPFFAEGGTVSMREFIVGAFNAEMGMQAPDPVLCAVTDPVNPQTMVTPAGFVFDPKLDVFERPPVCSTSADGDSDGITNEIDAALIDHMEFYFLNYFKPGRYQVTTRANEGLAIMNTIGCNSCHVQNLTVNRDRRVADVETVYDPPRGIFNDLFATAATLFHPVADGNQFPQLLPNEGSFVVQNFFSDLKRHDLGPNFHEREYNGTLVTQFVTEPLWGVGTTAPYGHDGRSVNLNEVILRHGGEAQTARNNYAARTEDERRKIQEFLATLVLFPPDDTASNLNPGNPNTTTPQVPAQHGSIDLSQLFQIPAEGAE